ncbi:ExeM/NucH family extracellular endonuclease [Curtobacterium albidum]|uniref:ExeM/NucH family extracellular endonuclease n=1 Tax=Curtobacterium citreum TaxID=2036 RepID=UPI0020273197|nr:ExeM/NucH family extracellular endonuclease [Curtobacterium albidum]MCL9663704.1 ExeM/NucH family extracellular endonuclease [Curtobacterium albidum]
MPNLLRRTVLCATVAATIVAAPLVSVTTAVANPAGTGLVISEAYLKGGSANAFYKEKFVEIANPTATPVSLAGWSLQYRSATATGNFSVSALEGTVPANGTFLVSMAGNGGANAVGAALPAADDTASINPSGTTGTLALSDGAGPLALPAGPVANGTPGVVDLLGYGASNTYEGTVRTVPGVNNVPNGLTRSGTTDTDVNGADFSVTETLTPRNAAGETGGATPADPEPTDPGTPAGPAEAVTIAQLQGTGTASPYVGKRVVTDGVVTAVYATGGLNGYTVQTAGTGGAIDLATHTASDAVFVFSAATAGSVAIGDAVRLTGTVAEYDGLTELEVASTADVERLPAAGVVQPVPATLTLPRTDAQRESLESMLVAPQGDYTVADNYTTNQYGEIALAAGTKRLVQPTEVARPGSAEYAAVVADNAARKVVLDDGASTNFLPRVDQSQAAREIPVSWLTQGPVTVGAAATFSKPVVLDYRNDAWKFQPTRPITGATPAADLPASFSDVRTAAPEDVGGDLKLAGFNVLNYFPTTGDQLTGCKYFVDRAGNPLTVNSGCNARGAANADDLERQQVKIVKAINALGADVVSLEEIENSAAFGQDRDAAVATLVAALNRATGQDTWAYAKSPAKLAANEDVIRLALIYKKDRVAPTGESTILTDSDVFQRQPVADAFRPVGGTAADDFLVIANHFKSKGSGIGENADQGDGQGASNADRVRQAQALATFSTSMQQQYGTDRVFLIGDFNAYSEEDPMVVLRDAGYTDLAPAEDSSEYSYVFSGLSGSLDHVLASPAALAAVTGVDIWNINSTESVGLEYSRHNVNVSDLYRDDVYRASDHDPILVGFDLAEDETPTPGDGETPAPGTGTTPAPGTGVGQAPAAPSASSLTGANRGGVTAPASARAGETITVGVGSALAGQRVSVWLYSDPVLLGTAVVAADGTVRVTIPPSTATGQHRLAVTAADGSLVGWTDIRIDPATGELAFTGAELTGGLVAALLLLAAGTGLVVARRRRAARTD